MPQTKREPRRRRVRSRLIDEDGQKAIGERDVTVTGAEANANMLAARMAPVFAGSVDFYLKNGDTSREAAIEKAKALETHAQETIAQIPPKSIEWWSLSGLAKVDFQAAMDTWEKVKQHAREDIATGTYQSEKVFPNASPYERAIFFAMREELADGWTPKNGVEHILIDMMAMSFCLFLHWTEIAHTWATGFVKDLRQEHHSIFQPTRHAHGWTPPRMTEGESIDRAHRLADGHHRAFMRALRHLRDLRRYSPPMIVNNGGQVNVANQQVNANSAK